jgi:hypothetical protein
MDPGKTRNTDRGLEIDGVRLNRADELRKSFRLVLNRMSCG